LLFGAIRWRRPLAVFKTKPCSKFNWSFSSPPSLAELVPEEREREEAAEEEDEGGGAHAEEDAEGPAEPKSCPERVASGSNRFPRISERTAESFRIGPAISSREYAAKDCSPGTR